MQFKRSLWSVFFSLCCFGIAGEPGSQAVVSKAGGKQFKTSCFDTCICGSENILLVNPDVEPDFTGWGSEEVELGMALTTSNEYRFYYITPWRLSSFELVYLLLSSFIFCSPLLPSVDTFHLCLCCRKKSCRKRSCRRRFSRKRSCRKRSGGWRWISKRLVSFSPLLLWICHFWVYCPY